MAKRTTLDEEQKFQDKLRKQVSAIEQIGSSRTGVQTGTECNCRTAGSVCHSASRGFNRLVGDFADEERFFILVDSDCCIFHSLFPFVRVEWERILLAKCLFAGAKECSRSQHDARLTSEMCTGPAESY